MRTLSLMKSCVLTARLTVAAVVSVDLILAGRTANPRNVYQQVKELEPAAEKRNQKLCDLSGVPEEKSN